MASRPLMHFFLIAALIFGEFAANVHLIGHFHAGDVAASSFSSSLATSPACDGSAGRFSAWTSEEHSHEHDHEHYTGADSNPEIQADCSIYHAFLGHQASLESAFALSGSAPSNALPRLDVDDDITSRSTTISRIRGPPHIS